MGLASGSPVDLDDVEPLPAASRAHALSIDVPAAAGLDDSDEPGASPPEVGI